LTPMWGEMLLPVLSTTTGQIVRLNEKQQDNTKNSNIVIKLISTSRNNTAIMPLIGTLCLMSHLVWQNGTVKTQWYHAFYAHQTNCPIGAANYDTAYCLLNFGWLSTMTTTISIMIIAKWIYWVAYKMLGCRINKPQDVANMLIINDLAWVMLYYIA